MSKALELAEMIEGVRAPYCGAAATELRRLAAVEAERDALKVKLDICLRYTQGEAEDPALLANDYGGLGYEKDPACLAVGAIALELERIRAMEPVACIQHYKGDKGRLFFVTDVEPPPGSPEYIEDVSWTLLYTLEKP